MHPSARPMSANMSRIAAGGLQGKIVVARRYLFVTRSVSRVPFCCCVPEIFSVGTRKDFVISTKSERSYL
jgi:hypothetical protein